MEKEDIEEDRVPTPIESEKIDHGWAMAAHLASMTGYLGNGVGCVLGPLIVWLIKREKMPLVDD